MGIKFLCDTCGKKLNIKEELAGKKGRCPKCNAVIKIPEQSEIGASENEDASKKDGKRETESVGATRTASTTKAEKKPPSPKTKKEKTAAQPKNDNPPPVPTQEQQLESEISPPEEKRDHSQDAFAANPDAKWFVRPSSGGQFGPAESDVMKTWIGEGRVGRDSLVWCEGWEEWQPAAEIFGDELGASPPQEKSEVKTSEPKSSNSGLNRAISHQQSRQRARMMGIILVVGLAFLSIALAVVLFIVVNNSSKKKEPEKDNNENKTALLYFAPAKNHNQVVNPRDLI